MNKLLLGRYLPGDSLIHKMDPRSKVLLSFYFILVIFLCNNWQSYAFLGAFTLVCILLSKINLGYFIRGVKALVFLILFTVAIQVLFTKGGHVYWQWGIFNVSDYGIINGGYLFLRILYIIIMSTLFTLTTQPLDIASGLESLMMPLKKFKVPVYEIALMISIALRFVPTLMDEADNIINAQRSRGVNFGEGGLIHQAKMIIPILIPLFVSSIKKAEDLAIAMEARGYRGGEGRTKFKIQQWHTRDTMGIFIFLLVTGVLFFLRN